MPRFGERRDRRRTAELDRRLRPRPAPPGQPRRLGHREHRPDPGGPRGLAAGRDRAAARRAADRGADVSDVESSVLGAGRAGLSLAIVACVLVVVRPEHAAARRYSSALGLAALAAASIYRRASGSCAPTRPSSRARSSRMRGAARRGRAADSRADIARGARPGLRRRPRAAALAAAASRRGRARARSSATRSTDTPWRRGRRLVDEDGAPLTRRRHRAGHRSSPPSPRAPTSASSAPRSCVVRDDPALIRARGAAGRPRASSPTARSARTRAARSRCTASRPTSRRATRPALACPCHYSVFDTRDGGQRRGRPRRADRCRSCR